MRLSIKISVAVVMGALCITSYSETFTNVTHALEVVIQGEEGGIEDLKKDLEANTYLLEHPEESTEPLLEIVKNQGDGWASASSILVEIKNDQIVDAYIKLLADKMYKKEAIAAREYSFTRWEYSYAELITLHLGMMGDKRAVPILRKSADEGSCLLRQAAYESLYNLEAISIDRLYEIAAEENYRLTSRTILNAAINTVHTNPTLACSMLDRIIEFFPGWREGAGLAHFYKMDCYDKQLERYEDALHEADMALKYPEIDSRFEIINWRKRQLLLKIDASNHRIESVDKPPVDEVDAQGSQAHP